MTMEELVKEERKAYFKKWRSENRDKTKKHNEDFWKRRAEKKLQTQNKESTGGGETGA